METDGRRLDAVMTFKMERQVTFSTEEGDEGEEQRVATWYKTEGGEKNTIEIEVFLKDKNGNKISSGTKEYNLNLSLWYEDEKTKVLPARKGDAIMNMTPLRPMFFEGRGRISLRINVVSKSHNSRKFVLRCDVPDLGVDHVFVHADSSIGKCKLINVKSKLNWKKAKKSKKRSRGQHTGAKLHGNVKRNCSRLPRDNLDDNDFSNIPMLASTSSTSSISSMSSINVPGLSRFPSWEMQSQMTELQCRVDLLEEYCQFLSELLVQQQRQQQQSRKHVPFQKYTQRKLRMHRSNGISPTTWSSAMAPNAGQPFTGIVPGLSGSHSLTLGNTNGPRSTESEAAAVSLTELKSRETLPERTTSSESM